MIAFLFRKSNGLTYFLAAAFLAVIVHLKTPRTPHSFLFEEQLFTFLLLFAQLVTIDWGIKSNGWTKKGSDHLYIFLCLILVAPWSTNHISGLIFDLFFWLSFLQLTRFSQKKGTEKHVFNASFLFLSGVLFLPETLVLFPLIWLLLVVFRQLNGKNFLVSLLPFFAFALLEGIAVFFDMHLIPRAFPVTINFSFSFPSGVFENFRWIVFVLLSFLASARHLADVNAKSAAYGTGINALVFLLVFSGLLGMFVLKTAGNPWGIFAMVLSTMTSRLIEKINRPIIRELVVFMIFVALFASEINIEQFF